MTHLRAVAIAAFFLGVGMAGEPFAPLHALIAGVIVVAVALIFERRTTPLMVFLVGFFGVLFVCYLQHHEIYPGSGVVGIGLGALGASSYGRRTAPAVIAGLGALVGVALFFLLGG